MVVSRKMRKKCRIWWPKDIPSCKSPVTLLFGWFVSSPSADSLDVVVAYASSEPQIAHLQLEYQCQRSLDHTNRRMPTCLQEKTKFSLLGQCAADVKSSGPQPTIDRNLHITNGLETFSRERHNGIFEQSKQASNGTGYWLELVYDSGDSLRTDVVQIPKLHHIHWNGQLVSCCDLHVIMYETPIFGDHHISLGHGTNKQRKTTLKKPNWVVELHRKQQLPDMDTVILAINCVAAAKVHFQRYEATMCQSFMNRCASFMWQLLAMTVASILAPFYILLQFLHSLSSCASQSWIRDKVAKIFCHTLENIEIRCSQILYWPIFLRNNDIRSASCVEYAEKAALHKYSVWSSVAIDVLLGNLIGLTLLFYSDAVYLWAADIVNGIINNLLRSGCVWLMGAPAGFKLNTELARLIGIISLNAIQIGSTLWFSLGSLFIYLIRALAISGILFGITIPAALIIDIIVLATLHVSALHWVISFVYSLQIQAIASLWRLFRGRKLNPLRQRLDSYDYTVEQHIVGSLLFSPLLLLLPTTSVFYIFFSLVNTTISTICILIEVTISIIHATPYMKIFLWLMRPQRFPSGVWFEIIACRSSDLNYPNEASLACENLQMKNGVYSTGCSFLVSSMHSNHLNLGQIVLPHYRRVFCGVSKSFVTSSAHKILTGRRFPANLGTRLPPKLPWMSIPAKEYWFLCRDSLLASLTRSERRD